MNQLKALFINRIKFNFVTILALVVLTIVIWLVLPPLFLLIWNSLKLTQPGVPGQLTLINYLNVYSDPAIRPWIVNSFVYAIWKTLFAISIAFALAWLIERTNVHFRNLGYIMILSAMIIPGIVEAIAWTLLLDPNMGIINNVLKAVLGLNHAVFNIYSLGGMIFVGGLRSVTIMFLFLAMALREMDPSLEEAATMSGANIFSVFRRVTLPLLVPAIGAAAVYGLVVGLEGFEVPAVLGMPSRIYVMTTAIWMAMKRPPPDYGTAGALAVGLLVVAIIGMLLYQYITRQKEKYVTITGKGYRPRQIDLGRWRKLGGAILLLYIVVSVILPVLVLFWASLLPFFQAPSLKALKFITFDNYWGAIKYPGVIQAIKNSIFLAVTGGVSTMFLAALISWIALRSKFKGRKILDLLAFTPLAVPAIVLSLAAMYVYLSFPNPIYGTIWILLIVFVTKYMPWATRATNIATIQIHNELEEAAQISGASWWQTFSRILVPILRPAFIGGFLYVFIHIIREFAVAMLLYSPKSNLISIIIWELKDAGTTPQLSALSIMFILLISIVAIAGRRWLEKSRA